MRVVIAIAGVFTVLTVLLDAFETVVLPRRVQRQFRLTSWFFRNTWIPWTKITRRIQSPSRRENFLGYFGPLSLLGLLALWAAGLILGFGFLQFGVVEHVQLGNEPVSFWTVLYLSGETFFTLGLGDVTPIATAARALTVLEGGMGFAFLGVVIGYLPTIYSAFSRREIEISLLDARAGSPPTAAELLARFVNAEHKPVLDDVFRGWERWSAEVLESHLSYPPLSFFRSQHSNQSWLGALMTILDASALVIAGIDGVDREQAKLTFAMARHAVVDLAQVVRATYDSSAPDRLPEPELSQLREMLAGNGVKLRDGQEFEQKLAQLRSKYEPYAQAIARNLVITLPPWFHPEKKRDNWQAGPWDRAIQAKGLAGLGKPKGQQQQRIDDHF